MAKMEDLLKLAPRGLGTGAKLLAASVAIGIGIHQSIYTGRNVAWIKLVVGSTEIFFACAAQLKVGTAL